MQDIGKQTKGAKKKIATWAKSKGTEHSRLQQFNGGGGQPCGYGIANAIVFSKVRHCSTVYLTIYFTYHLQ
jgi:long-chain-fatty-acid--CoA ligase ACSBG